MDPQQFEKYVKEARLLAVESQKDPRAKERLLKLVEAGKASALGLKPYEEFFEGEKCFFSGQYEHALQHYLEAKSIPDHQFFCYRASYYVSKARNNFSQAIKFAEKALQIVPDDPLMIAASSEAGMPPPNPSAPQDRAENKASQSFGEESPNSLEKAAKISLGYKKIEELAQIFEEPGREEEGLFSKASRDLLCSQQEVLSARGGKSHQSASSAATALEELQQLALEDSKPQAGSNAPSAQLELENALDERIKSFQNAQAALMNDYLDASRKHSKLADHRLYILNGWSDSQLEPSSQFGIPINRSLLTEESRKMTGGLYLRWNGKGIALNPGPGFLENFHQQGLCIKDIDFVIITRNQPDAYGDVKEIYELNNQLNRVSDELQIIHYHLCQQAYQDLSSWLKPSFKQARHTVHCLELFIDSPDVEKIELCEGIALNYFLTSVRDPFYRHAGFKDGRFPKAPEALGIRLDLGQSSGNLPDGSSQVRLGYISGTSWSPLLAHHLGSCDILIAGFGNTTPNDYSKIAYNEDCLGYHGTYSLLEEVAPSLLLSTEFGGREGDIRIEAIKKMRQELSHSNNCPYAVPVVMPADIGMLIDLKTSAVQCSVSQDFVDPSKIHVVKTRESFGRLQYLSSNCCIGN